ncbi:DUF3325 family protein [Acinetobacter sp. G11]|uniref:DUF3325 family protein n=1 Tax=Acinetobacter sp. G11 TaxID=3415989 RepID=UPI003C7DCF0F
MSLAAILWAIVAMMQLCMTSQSGMKKLNYNFLTFDYAQSSLKICAFIFMGISLYLNCLDHGLSVGMITWIFLIITSAFFLQLLFYYHFKRWFFFAWIFLFFLSVLYSLIKYTQ